MAARIFEPIDDVIVVHDYFGALALNPDRSFVGAAEVLERKAKIEEHPFFLKAKNNREALVLWASQEAIVTNPFSQILFRLMSTIKNVHVRSILLPVVHGEHSAVRNGVASRSHPWLIWRLCRSLGISEDRILVTKAIRDFISVLEAAADDPMRALGVLGIGNELMLLAEYGAIQACFDAVCPEADYREFLQANIGEDETHTRLIGDAAAALVEFGYSSGDFIEGARVGVEARVSYYDALLKEVL
jgi:hypothetical protein